MSSRILDFAALKRFYPITDDATKAIWYVHCATVLEVASHPEYIEGLWRHVISDVDDEMALLSIARRMRETFLKGCALAGFPRGINCLSALNKAIEGTSPDIASALATDMSIRAKVASAETQRRGEEFFSSIYSKNTDRILENMRSTSGGDLDQFVLFSVYGGLMAEMSILNAKETSLVEFVACYAGMAVPQAKGHMYGAKNLGNTKEDVQAAIDLVQAMAPFVAPVPFAAQAFPFTAKVDEW